VPTLWRATFFGESHQEVQEAGMSHFGWQEGQEEVIEFFDNIFNPEQTAVSGF